MHIRNVLSSLIVVAALLGVPSTASAQMIPQSVQIDIMGGYYWFPSNVQNYNSSGIVGGRLLRRVIHLSHLRRRVFREHNILGTGCRCCRSPATTDVVF